jgi:hypothetical protein
MSKHHFLKAEKKDAEQGEPVGKISDSKLKGEQGKVFYPPESDPSRPGAQADIDVIDIHEPSTLSAVFVQDGEQGEADKEYTPAEDAFPKDPKHSKDIDKLGVPLIDDTEERNPGEPSLKDNIGTQRKDPTGTGDLKSQVFARKGKGHT